MMTFNIAHTKMASGKHLTRCCGFVVTTVAVFLMMAWFTLPSALTGHKYSVVLCPDDCKDGHNCTMDKVGFDYVGNGSCSCSFGDDDYVCFWDSSCCDVITSTVKGLQITLAVSGSLLGFAALLSSFIVCMDLGEATYDHYRFQRVYQRIA